MELGKRRALENIMTETLPSGRRRIAWGCVGEVVMEARLHIDHGKLAARAAHAAAGTRRKIPSEAFTTPF